MASENQWLPLESNPDVMNKFLCNLGVPNQWRVGDVIGLDEESLQNVPRPVAAVMLLFPTGKQHEEFSANQQQEIEAAGETANDKVYFMQQSIKNACGTVALIHAVANSSGITLEPDSCLKEFLDSTKEMSPTERGQELEKNENIRQAHDQSAQEGQTPAPSLDEDVGLHFAAFVNVENNIYELDGRKKFPINHGETEADNFLSDAAAVCKQFIERDPDNVNFTVLVLATAEDN